MNIRTTAKWAALAVASGSVLAAAGAFAQSAGGIATRQETPAQARARAATSSLNGAPAETTLSPRANALPPLSDAERPYPVRPLAGSAPATQDTPAQTPTGPGEAEAEQAPSITLAPGQTAPDPIAMPLGYYVRGDKACNQVWPGEGDLAWFTPTSFTIDFGGCDPGQFLQTGPNAWSEDQQCKTELGGDAGLYHVTYEAIEPGVIQRRATLAIDGHVEQDLWRHCEVQDVPEEARFKS